MDTKTAAAAPAAASSAELAKAALRRLVLARLEPTPENFARAFRTEAGHLGTSPQRAERVMAMLDRLVALGSPQAEPGRRRAIAQALLDGQWDQAEREFEALWQDEAPGAALAALLESIVRGLERGGRQWTTARRKESLQRVLVGSRMDAQLLQRRLTQLVASWDGDAAEDLPTTAPADLAVPPLPATVESGAEQGAASAPGSAWAQVMARVAAALQPALGEDGAASLAPLLALQGDAAPGAEALEAATRLATAVERSVGQRERLVGQLTGLCVELTQGLSDLAEDDSWARGQLDAMRQTLADGVTSRGVRAAGELLRRTRDQQLRLRDERAQARDALKGMIGQMLAELGDLGTHTGRFQENVGRYAEVIDRAESLEGLAGVVGDMLAETRSVQDLVGQTQTRLQTEHARATALSDRVVELENELRRLSDEVSTDQLTQVANRRGLMQAFEVARAQAERDGRPLAVGLLDVDNFKRLNDELGHSAGDVALRSLAGAITQSPRPPDAAIA